LGFGEKKREHSGALILLMQVAMANQHNRLSFQPSLFAAAKMWLSLFSVLPFCARTSSQPTAGRRSLKKEKANNKNIFASVENVRGACFSLHPQQPVLYFYVVGTRTQPLDF